MTGDRPRNEELRQLAAEYALGLLADEDLRKARELELTDRSFKDEVDGWTRRLSPLLDEVDELPVPADVWRTVERRIGGAASNDNLINLNRRVAKWRAIAGAMAALAACLAVALMWNLPSTMPARKGAQHAAQAPMVAMLGDQGNGTKVMASWDPGAQQLVLAVAGDLKGDPSHSHELWVIPKGGKPTSLGTMPATKQMHMQLAETLARLLDSGATIAISVEPRGGSPTGAPTGPVIASGSLSQA